MKDHLAFKFLAIVLCACALLVTVLSATGLISFMSMGLYDNSLEALQDRQMSQDLEELAQRIAAYYATSQTECIDPFLESYFSDYDDDHEIQRPKDGMWYYVLIDYNTKQTVDIGPGTQETTSGAILYKEYQVRARYPQIIDILDKTETPIIGGEPALDPDDSQSGETADYPDGWYTYEWYNENTFKDETYILVDADGPIYKVQLYLLPGAYEQEVAFLWELMAMAYEYRYAIFLPLVLGLLVLGLCLTYLCSTAGKKVGREERRPAALNRLPVDLYLLLAGALCVFLVNGYIQVIREYFSRETSEIIVLSILFTSYCACLLVTGAFFACAAQLQMGGGYWWRHSFVYNFCKLLRRGARSLLRLLGVCRTSLKKTWRHFMELLPLTWQWILWVVVMCALLIVTVLSRNIWLICGALLVVGIFFFYALHAYKILLDGAKRMSQGDLDTQVDKSQLMAGFADFATHLNALADVAVVAAQKHMRSERMRAELITNVSHDIKTPLTSIINYVDLLKSAKTKEEAEQYLEVLSRQSLRMKKLIDDLIELSKASTGNMPVDIQSSDAVEYLNQAIGEFADKLDAVPLTPIFEQPDGPVMMRCDSRLTWRVLSNLFSNAVKYALPGTRLYIDVADAGEHVLISLKNISREQLNVSSDELMERFVRGDASRNTEGSGLGLNIAKSLMELQKGQLQLLVDGDLFKATLVFPKAEI